jgi:hypothetical protein
VRSHIFHSQSMAVIVLDCDPRKHKPVMWASVDHPSRQEPQHQVNRQTDQPYGHESNWRRFRHAERPGSGRPCPIANRDATPALPAAELFGESSMVGSVREAHLWH